MELDIMFWAAANVVLAMLIAMLVTWVNEGRPHYPSMDNGQTIAYVFFSAVSPSIHTLTGLLQVYFRCRSTTLEAAVRRRQRSYRRFSRFSFPFRAMASTFQPVGLEQG
jgi:hypothetical protein